MGDSIVDILYTYGGGATFFSISGLPNGVQAQPTGNPNEEEYLESLIQELL